MAQARSSLFGGARKSLPIRKAEPPQLGQLRISMQQGAFRTKAVAGRLNVLRHSSQVNFVR